VGVSVSLRGVGRGRADMNECPVASRNRTGALNIL
jgi:hypothetical protein